METGTGGGPRSRTDLRLLPEPFRTTMSPVSHLEGAGVVDPWVCTEGLDRSVGGGVREAQRGRRVRSWGLLWVQSRVESDRVTRHGRVPWHSEKEGYWERGPPVVFRVGEGGPPRRLRHQGTYSGSDSDDFGAVSPVRVGPEGGLSEPRPGE